MRSSFRNLWDISVQWKSRILLDLPHPWETVLCVWKPALSILLCPFLPFSFLPNNLVLHEVTWRLWNFSGEIMTEPNQTKECSKHIALLKIENIMSEKKKKMGGGDKLFWFPGGKKLVWYHWKSKIGVLSCFDNRGLWILCSRFHTYIIN